MPDDVALPPVSQEFQEGEKFKEQEQNFIAGFFDNATLDRNKPKPKYGDDIEFPEEEQPAAENLDTEKKDKDKADTPAPDPEKKEDETPADGLTPTEGGDSTEEKPAATPAAAAQPATAPVIDHNAIADAVASRLEKKPAASATPENPFAQFSESDQRQLRVLDHLEKTNPKYKGVTVKAQEFFTREVGYKQKWLKENPGEAFNPQDDAHRDFYDKFEPQVDPEDLNEAKIDMRAHQIASKVVDEQVSERMKPFAAQAAAAERLAVENEVRPRIEQAANLAVVDLAVQAVPEFKELMPNNRLTIDSIKAMKEKDPAAFELLDREAVLLKARVREVDAMIQMPDHFQFDENLVVKTKAGTIRPHSDIAAAHSDLEQQWLEKPQAQRVRDGRTFVPQRVMAQAIERCNGDQAKEAALWDRFFIIGPEDIKAEIIRRSAENVRSNIDLVKKVSGGASKKAPSAGTNGTPSGTAEPPAKPAQSRAPATIAASDTVDTKIPAAPATPSQTQVVASKMFG